MISKTFNKGALGAMTYNFCGLIATYNIIPIFNHEPLSAIIPNEITKIYEFATISL